MSGHSKFARQRFARSRCPKPRTGRSRGLFLERLESRHMLAADLLVADPAADRILRFAGDTGELLEPFVDSGSGGLVQPHDPTVGPTGNVYVFSGQAGQGQQILEYDSAGTFRRVFVDHGDGGLTAGSAMTFGPDGDLYVATNGPDGVLRFDGSDGSLRDIIGDDVGVRRAAGLAFGPDGALYVLDADGILDSFTDRILRFDTADPSAVEIVVEPGILDDAADFSFGPDGHLYVPDLAIGNVVVLSTSTGQALRAVASESALAGAPVFSVTFDAQGNLYASVPGNVLKFDAATSAFLGEFIATHSSYVTFLTPPGPVADLAVTDIQTPAGSVQGNQSSLSYTVSNNSEEVAAGGWVDVVYLSADRVFDPGDAELARVTNPTDLQPGGSVTNQVTFNLDGRLGDYHFLVFTNRWGSTPEHIRQNNVLSSTVPIEVRPPLCASHSPDDSIAVGRTLSQYSTANFAPDQETLSIRYTVYNLQPCRMDSVVLSTSLASELEVLEMSPLAQADDHGWTWSLGTLEPMSSKTVDVLVGSNDPFPLQLDDGPVARARVDASVVGDSLPPAQLRTDPIDPAWLASTVDADTTDPFLRALAARLDQRADRIFDFLTRRVGFESYVGSLRGARGALWSGAGNAMDQSSLMIGLLRTSGIPARYAHGMLPDVESQRLIDSMFPVVTHTNGYVAAGAPLADPRNDADLLTESRHHTWVEVDTGDALVPADPTLPDSIWGIAYAPLQGTSTVIPDSMRHEVTLRLDRELAIPALGIFGGSPLDRTTVLEGTFPAAGLAGKPISIGHIVSQNTATNQLARATTNTYSPYYTIGDVGDVPAAGDGPDFLFGDDYQEVVTSFPLGSQVLTGLFLQIELTRPGGGGESWERTLVDRIGIDVRRNGGSPRLEFSPDGPPTLTDLDVFTVHVSAGLHEPTAFARSVADRQHQLAILANTANASQQGTAMRSLIEGIAWARGIDFMVASDAYTAYLADRALVRAYFDEPRVIITSGEFDEYDGLIRSTIDLRHNMIRAIPYPSQASGAGLEFQSLRGFADSIFESDLLAEVDTANPVGAAHNISTAGVFQAAAEQQIDLYVIDQDNPTVVDLLEISAAAKARIADAVSAGKVVTVPRQAVKLHGETTIAWYEFSPLTGEIVGVLEDGTHGGISDFALIYAFNFAKAPSYSSFVQAPSAKGLLHGGTAGIALNAAYSLCKNKPTDFRKAAEAATGSSLPNRFHCRALMKKTSFHIKNLIRGKATLDPQYKKVFVRHFEFWLSKDLKNDPPVPEQLTGTTPLIETPLENDRISEHAAGQRHAGTVSGQVDLLDVAIAGSVSLRWDASTGFALPATAADIDIAEVLDTDGTSLGTGQLTWTSADPTSVVSLQGAQLEMHGSGRLSVYAGAANKLVDAAWNAYQATLTGQVALEVTDGRLLLDGVELTAGRYTIVTDTASLTGTGTMAAVNAAGSLAVSMNDAAVQMGSSAGELQLADGPLSLSSGAALSGFAGTVDLSLAGSQPIRTTLNGVARAVLRLPDLATVAVDPNGSTLLEIDVESSHTGEFTYAAEGPPGWIVEFTDTGSLQVVPRPGTPPGEYQLLLTAQAESDPDLIAHAVAAVEVLPASPGLALDVTPDELFFVPVGGAQVFTAYEANLRNLGPAGDRFELTFPDPPAGWKIFASQRTVDMGAGGTASVGIYLQPTAAVGPPGGDATFQVRATSTTDPVLIETRTIPLTVPEVFGVTLATAPTVVSIAPGETVSIELVVQSHGNVRQETSLSSELSSNWSLDTPTTVELEPGETKRLTITITAPANAVLNSTQALRLLGDFGTPQPAEWEMDIRVVAPGVESLARAATTAREVGHADLADRLDDLSRAVTELVQATEESIFKSQAVAALDAIVELAAADEILRHLASDIAARRDQLASAATPQNVLQAITELAAQLAQFDETVANLSLHDFDVALSPNVQVARPQLPAEFQVTLQNTGQAATTYQLALSTVPNQVQAELSHSEVTLMPGQFAGDDLRVRVIQPVDALQPFEFQLDVTVVEASAITRSTTGSILTRAEFADLVSVNADPPFTDPGDNVHVWTRVLNAVNRERTAEISFQVLDADGQAVHQSSPVTTQLSVRASTADVYLGAINTTNFPLGEYSIEARIELLEGDTVSTSSGTGYFRVGSPISARLTVDPQILPPGDSTFVHSLRLEATPNFPSPLALQGHVDLSAATDVAVLGNWAFVCGSQGIDIVDIADPMNPAVVDNVDQGASSCEVRGDRLVTVLGPQLPTEVVVFDVSDPARPTRVGDVDLDYDRAANVVIGDDSAFFATNAFCLTRSGIFSPFDVVDQHGDVLSIDLSDPANPQLADVLFNTFGTASDGDPAEEPCPRSGGPSPVFQVVAVDDDTLLAATTTTLGSDTQSGVGRLLVLDVSDPANLQVVNELEIPGTVVLAGLAISGDLGLVSGSAGGFRDPVHSVATEFAPLGPIVLTTLDLTNPRNPQIVSSQSIDKSPRGLGAPVAVGDARFVISRLGTVDESAELMLVDAANPSSLVVTPSRTADVFQGMRHADGRLFAAGPAGLSIYDVGIPQSISTTVEIMFPNGTGVVPNMDSFSVAPTRIPGDSFDTYQLTVPLSAAQPQVVSWESSIANLKAGELREVTQESRVMYSLDAANHELALPATKVAGYHVLGLRPAHRDVRPGVGTTFLLDVFNPRETAMAYDLALAGVPAEWVTLESPVQLAPGQLRTLGLTIEPSPFAPLDTIDFVVLADQGETDIVHGSLTLIGPPQRPLADAESYGVHVEIVTPLVVGGRDTPVPLTARITNTGSAVETVELSVDFPAGFADFLPFIDVPPGVGNYRDVTLDLYAEFGVEVGDHPFELQATSSSRPNVSASDTGIFRLVDFGVDVELLENDDQPGTFEFFLFNTGSTSETFDLSLAGPVAMYAYLPEDQVTLAPFDSYSVMIEVSELTTFVPGSHRLVALARSQSHPGIGDFDTADVTVVAERGLGLEITPQTHRLKQPQAATFLLAIENRGNTLEEYIATVDAVEGDLEAQFVSPTGELVGSLEGLRLPALSTGVIELIAVADRPTVGTVTVRVESLLDANYTATVTGMVSSCPWHNLTLPHDTNGDGIVAPLDVLIVINELNRRINQPAELAPPTASLSPPPHLDVNCDNQATPRDVLLIINFLNAAIATREGEALPAQPTAQHWADAGPLPWQRSLDIVAIPKPGPSVPSPQRSAPATEPFTVVPPSVVPVGKAPRRGLNVSVLDDHNRLFAEDKWRSDLPLETAIAVMLGEFPTGTLQW